MEQRTRPAIVVGHDPSDVTCRASVRIEWHGPLQVAGSFNVLAVDFVPDLIRSESWVIFKNLFDRHLHDEASIALLVYPKSGTQVQRSIEPTVHTNQITDG
jgi:hypothetical protein